MPEVKYNTTSNKAGEFARNASKHRGTIAQEPEAGRYHLYVSMACPWAAGALSMLYLKGLDGPISLSIVHPTWAKTKPDDPSDTHHGWAFKKPGDEPFPNALGHGSNDCDDALVPDSINGCSFLRDLYALCGDEEGPFTTPVLWDKQDKVIISNESMDILRILNSKFNNLARNPEVDLYPSDLEETLAKLNEELVYPNVNNGVYRSGFATSQEAYEKAVTGLFRAMNQLEEKLGSQRFLGGDRFTWLDLRLYHTLVRFDPVYVVYFKTNLQRVADYPNLLGFIRDVYSIEPIKRATNIKHIKAHYFTSHPRLNTYGIIPISNGPDLTVPHGRGPPVDLAAKPAAGA